MTVSPAPLRDAPLLIRAAVALTEPLAEPAGGSLVAAEAASAATRGSVRVGGSLEEGMGMRVRGRRAMATPTTPRALVDLMMPFE